MAILGWGKPRIFIKKLGDSSASWKELPTPVENSTTLETTKGDKQEAKIEGGANEDVRYSKNTYALNLNIRAAKGRKKPITDNDGIVTSNYAVMLQPEDTEVDGISIEKSAVSVEDTWSSEEGGIWAYAFDALQPESGDQVKWGKVSVTEAEGVISDVSFTESEEED